MTWMNRFDIEDAARRHSGKPVLGKASNFLYSFMEQVDNNSDGWPYWSAPSHAAAKLMDLIQGKVEATEANYKAAMTPIKSFMTRKGRAAGMSMPVVW